MAAVSTISIDLHMWLSTPYVIAPSSHVIAPRTHVISPIARESQFANRDWDLWKIQFGVFHIFSLYLTHLYWTCFLKINIK